MAMELSSSSIYHEGDVRLVNIAYLWTIRNFLQLKEQMRPGSMIESPSFTSDGCTDPIWRMRMYLDVVGRNRQEYLSLYLQLGASQLPRVLTKFRFSLCDNNGEKVTRALGVHPFIPGDVSGVNNFVAVNQILEQRQLYLPSGELRILCRVLVEEEGLRRKYEESVDRFNVLVDLTALMQNKTCSDLKIVIGKEEFYAHRCILAARTPDFFEILENKLTYALMYGNNIVEPAVELTDIEPAVMREILRFIYCGTLENLSSVVHPLIYASDRYKLPRLKAICEEGLFPYVNVHCAGQYLTLAMKTNAPVLKQRVMEFITFHHQEVVSSPGFKELEKTNPQIANAIKSQKIALN